MHSALVGTDGCNVVIYVHHTQSVIIVNVHEKNAKLDVTEKVDQIQWNLSIAVIIGAKFFGCYRQVAALMR